MLGFGTEEEGRRRTRAFISEVILVVIAHKKKGIPSEVRRHWQSACNYVEWAVRLWLLVGSSL